MIDFIVFSTLYVLYVNPDLFHQQLYLSNKCNKVIFVLYSQVSTTLPEKDREIQTYITLIGCSLSLFGLVITVLLFITNR